jgi:hypothetical protein
MKEIRRWGVNPSLKTGGYNMPLWLQEVLQELRSQNKKKTVICSK